MQEIIKEMLRVEQRAREIVRQAEEEASRIIDKANQQAHYKREEIINKAKKESEEIISRRKAEALKLRENTLKQAEEEAEKLPEQISAKRSDAIELVISTILDGRA